MDRILKHFADLETLSLSAHGDHVLVVTLDRPAVANALNTQMGYDQRALWSELYRDAGGVRAVLTLDPWVSGYDPLSEGMAAGIGDPIIIA